MEGAAEEDEDEEEDEEDEELQVVQVSEKEFNFLDYLKRCVRAERVVERVVGPVRTHARRRSGALSPPSLRVSVQLCVPSRRASLCAPAAELPAERRSHQPLYRQDAAPAGARPGHGSPAFPALPVLPLQPASE